MGNQRKAVERVCPWCHKLIRKHFARHLKAAHGKTVVDYCLYHNNLTEVPECAYSKCHEKVSVDYSHMEHFKQFCGNRKCPNLYKAEHNEHQFQHDNRERLEDGSDVIMRGVTERGNNPFSKENRKLDSEGRDIMSRKGSDTRNSEGVNPFLKTSEYYSDMLDQHIYTKSSEDRVTECYLYVFKDEASTLMKIGSSKSPTDRLASFRKLGVMPSGVKLVKSNLHIIRRMERGLLNKFTEYRKRPPEAYPSKTEWLDIKAYDEVVNLLDKIVAKATTV